MTNTSKKMDAALLKIPIKDALEPLVSLKTVAEEAHVPIIFKEEQPYLRQSVAKNLMAAAADFASQNYSLVLESSYRSLSQQSQLYQARLKALTGKYPKKTEEQIIELADTYTAGVPVLAAHTAGAAVDVTLLDNAGQTLDFGVPYRYGGAESITDFPKLPPKAKSNRKLLKEVLAKHGFVNYPFEYWHYSIGDVCATYLGGSKEAIYGPVNFNRRSGKIVAPSDYQQIYRHFKSKEQ